MIVTREISVDVSKRNVFSAIVAKQNDSNSRFLKVTITNLGEKMSVDANATVIINALRKDGAAKSFMGEANGDGTVTVPLTVWMLELDDEVQCDISIISTEDRKLTTTTFILAVEAASCSSENISEDENFDLLISLINDAKACVDAEAVRVVAENERISNENARKSAEKARQEAEATRNNKEQERITAETARNTAEGARATAMETAVENANTAAQSATTAATNATNAAQQVASALIAGGVLPLYDEDAQKNYSYQIKIKNGFPVLVMIEATATTE